jgi:UDP-N-acetylmuramoyl-tripeptide--D-alanyl-D-alanine ligase
VKVAGVSERADPELRGDLQGPEADGRYTVRFWGREVLAGIPGKHGAANLVLALAMARLLGAEADSAVRGAAGIQGGKLRGEVRPLGGLTLLLDCYNANPQSVSAALELLTEIPASGGRVAVLASMLELGTRSSALHRQALEGALALPLDIVVAVGEFADAAAGIGRGPSDRPRLLPAQTPEAGYRALRPHLAGSETVLLKGSRGMELERLVDRFEEDFGSGAAGPRGDA